jgi:hypothetical protein
VPFITLDGIVVYTRKDWGARAPKSSYSPLGRIESAVIHHGGPVGKPRMTKSAAAETCRSWQSYHMDSNGWNDIGYHFLVDGLGRIYLGRPSDAMGAHVLNQNSNRVGINFMQDGRYYGLTLGQKRTLKKLFKYPHHKLALPALKDLARHPGDRWGVFGHREVPGQSTECPGDKILADYKAIMRKFL